MAWVWPEHDGQDLVEQRLPVSPPFARSARASATLKADTARLRHRHQNRHHHGCRRRPRALFAFDHELLNHTPATRIRPERLDHTYRTLNRYLRVRMLTGRVHEQTGGRAPRAPALRRAALGSPGVIAQRSSDHGRTTVCAPEARGCGLSGGSALIAAPCSRMSGTMLAWWARCPHAGQKSRRVDASSTFRTSQHYKSQYFAHFRSPGGDLGELGAERTATPQRSTGAPAE